MAQASYPAELKYHPEHDWARIDGDEATFGITWYAQDSLGEIVFFDAPAVGTVVTKDEQYTEVESVNEDPYGEGWLVKVKLSDPSEADSLLDASDYEASLS